ncbi:MAG: site-specific integrase, partial [Streptosporangiaceae bacterium]
MTPRYEIAVWLASCAGLRAGEALGLTVDRVRFLERKIIVDRQLQGGRLVEPKTRSSKRVIPIDAFLIDKLAAHIEQWGSGSELLITSKVGKPVLRGPFAACFRDAIERAGLPPGLHFHDLRHCFASM